MIIRQIFLHFDERMETLTNKNRKGERNVCETWLRDGTPAGVSFQGNPI